MKPLRAAIAVVVVSRAAVFLVGYLAVAAFGFPNGRPPVRDFDSELMNLPSRFDARWYLQIARDGYAYDPAASADVQQNIVFFPALPMAIRFVSALAGGSPGAAVLAGTVLSLAAFLGALVYLFLFVAETVDEDRAGTTLWLLAFYPFAIFYGAIYTESFLLLSAVGSIHHWKRGEYLPAAMWGLVAGLTRPNGFLLAIPLGLLALRGKRRALPLAAAASPVVGLLVYAAAIWKMTGHPWTWAAGHVAWGRTYQGLVALIADRVHMIATGGLAAYLTALPHDALNALGALFALATVWPVARSLGPEYSLWMLANILPPLAAGGLISAGRFSAVLFPSFVWLATAIPPRHRFAWVGAFAAIQALCAAMFYTWRPLY